MLARRSDWALLCLPPLAVLIALLVAVAPKLATSDFTVGHDSVHPPSTPGDSEFMRLPAAARGAVSRGIGGDDHSYWARRAGAGLNAVNGRQHFRVRFDRSGVTVSTAGGTAALGTARVGRGATLRSLGSADPSTHANRVVYRGATASQWFANGPLGLEQGFRLTRRPVGAAQAPAVVAMPVSGALRPLLARDGQSIVFKRTDGRAVLRYAQLSVTDARGRSVPARLVLSAGTVSIKISDRGARYPLSVDPTISQIAKLTASDGVGGDKLGYSMAVSGSTIAVGTQQDTTVGNTGPGAVYVFTKPASGGWQNATQTAKLTASDGATGDRLGTSVAISGSTIVAGAPYADIGSVLGKGAVYVFTEPASGWQDATETAKLTSSDGG